MKILNPTVFLRDGELFCLTVEVPKPMKCPSCGKDWDTFNHHSCECGAVIKGLPLKETAKSSAVKVKNIDDVRNWFIEDNDKNALSFQWDSETLYTLTGYEAEAHLILHCRQMNGSGCVEGCEVIPGTHGAMDCKFGENKSEHYATITPIHKEEESQEEIIWEFIDAFEELKNSPVLAVPELQKRFTITRKK